MSTVRTIHQLLSFATEKFASTSDSARLDAELLLAFVLDQKRVYLHTWPEKQLTREQEQRFLALIERRERGEPIAHLIGKSGFWTLDIMVNSATLVPRPETELLVEKALELIPQQAEWQIADLGTGSGAIALAIAYERPHCHLTAVDQSLEALRVAEANAIQLGLGNIHFVHGSWFEPLAEHRFEMILSNPPYIRLNDPHLSQGDVRFEPLTALTSGPTGLDDLRLICEQAPAYLRPGGYLLLEHGYDQGSDVRKLLEINEFSEVSTLRDIGGQERMSYGKRR